MFLNALKTEANLSVNEFIENYVDRNQPVIIKNNLFGHHAIEKWTPDYLKTKIGRSPVPVYSKKSSKSKLVNEADDYLAFSDFLDEILSRPSERRIFAYNIAQKANFLLNDLNYIEHPKLDFLERYPLMFFGGAGSKVFLHYDMDLSHVFTTQFYGRKRVIMFGPDQTPFLYKIPFAVHNLETIDIENPDFDKFPALRQANGFIGEISHGDTLFIPSRWWHYMHYLDGGYALSLRAFSNSYRARIRGFYNIFGMRYIDNLLRYSAPQKWQMFKEKLTYLY